MKYFLLMAVFATTLNGLIALWTEDYGYALGLFAGAFAFLSLFFTACKEEKRTEE